MKKHVFGMYNFFFKTVDLMQDKNRPSVEYWLRAFSAYAKRLAKQEGGTPQTLPPDMAIFPRFLANHLIEHEEACEHLSQFCSLLRSMKTESAELFPKPSMVDGLLALNACSGMDEADLSTLSLATRATLVASPLYKAWMEQSFEKRMSAVQARKLSPSELLPLLTPLAQSQPEDKRILFAQTWCGPSSDAHKIAYLMQTPERFQLLAFWFPTDPARHLLEFASTEPKFKDMTFQDYYACVEMLQQSVDAQSHIKFPVARSLLAKNQFY